MNKHLSPGWPPQKFEAVLAVFEADEVDSMADCPGFAACIRAIIKQRDEAAALLAADAKAIEAAREALTGCITTMETVYDGIKGRGIEPGTKYLRALNQARAALALLGARENSHG